MNVLTLFNFFIERIYEKENLFLPENIFLPYTGVHSPVFSVQKAFRHGCADLSIAGIHFMVAIGKCRNRGTLCLNSIES